MVKGALTKVPRPLNGEKIVYSTNGAGKTRCQDVKVGKRTPIACYIQNEGSQG